MKGEQVITDKALIFGVSNIGGHKNCFKLVSNTTAGNEKELIMYADAPNLKMKWIYAIESFIMEAKQAAEKQRILTPSLRVVRPVLPEEELLPMDDEAVTKALEMKAKSMITMVEKFVKAWMEGDELGYSSTVTAGNFTIIKR